MHTNIVGIYLKHLNYKLPKSNSYRYLGSTLTRNLSTRLNVAQST